MIRFNDIIGQEPIKKHLQTALAQNNVSHAYLFCGDSGSGRHTLAKAFARALLCEQPTPDHDACGHCKSCLQAASANHPDIRVITHEKFNIRVDEIREQLNNDIQIKPYSSKYKVYIIPDAHRMNEQAQNALLKTLEEPPAYAVIILLSDNESALLPTIVSRCITLQMKPVSEKDIADISGTEIADGTRCRRNRCRILPGQYRSGDPFCAVGRFSDHEKSSDAIVKTDR